MQNKKVLNATKFFLNQTGLWDRGVCSLLPAKSIHGRWVVKLYTRSSKYVGILYFDDQGNLLEGSTALYVIEEHV